jgi:hypothetical protein
MKRDCTAQMLIEDLAPAGFDLRERDTILGTAGRAYRITQADRATLVQCAAATSKSGHVNSALGAMLREMFRPFTSEEILGSAVAVSPCRTLAVLPLTERAFYQFVNPNLSPSMRRVFLWEQFQAKNAAMRFVSVNRESHLVERAWWSEGCRNLIYRSRGRLEMGARHWSSLGLMDEAVEPLVSLFPLPAAYGRVIVRDEFAGAIARQNEAFERWGRESTPVHRIEELQEV